jgi:amino acid transporter
MKRKDKLSLWEATAIAVGVIIGASVFSLIGVGAEMAGRDLPPSLSSSPPSPHCL